MLFFDLAFGSSHQSFKETEMFKNLVWGPVAMLFSGLVLARTVSSEGYLYLSEWLQVAQKNASSASLFAAVAFILVTLCVRYYLEKNLVIALYLQIFAIALLFVPLMKSPRFPIDDFVTLSTVLASALSGTVAFAPSFSPSQTRLLLTLSTFLMCIVAYRLLFFA
jgi:hypothetical protein